MHRFDTVTNFKRIYDGSAYNEPWVSYTDENEKVYYNKIKPIVTAKYLVSQTESPTIICTTGLSNVTLTMIVDGIEASQPETAVTFTSTGEHVVEFILNTTTVPYYSFGRNVNTIKSLTFNSGVKEIGQMIIVENNSLEEVILEVGVETLGLTSFLEMSALTKVVVPESVVSCSTSYSPFSECPKLSAFTSPLAVQDGRMLIIGTTLAAFATYGWSGISFVIPEGITNSLVEPGDEDAFNGITINSFTFPSTFTGQVGIYFTTYATNEIIAYPTTAPRISTRALYRHSSNGVLKHPAGSNYSTWLSELGSGWTEQTI